MPFQQVDGWNEALTLKPVLVQVTRLHIRRRHERDSVLKQGGKQTAQDHSVGDVRYKQLIETQYPGVPCNSFCDNFQRRRLILQRLELGMNVVHEAMEMP